jgi:hypothetical protein
MTVAELVERLLLFPQGDRVYLPADPTRPFFDSQGDGQPVSQANDVVTTFFNDGRGVVVVGRG